MSRDQAAPLIATIWLDRVARHLLADEMQGDFDEWWFWQAGQIDQVIEDGRACDDVATEAAETCDAIVAAALRQTIADLGIAYGTDPKTWRWGNSHRAQFAHPVFRNVPVVSDWLAADLPTDGDFFTVNRGTAMPPRSGVALNHVHGAGLRFVYDFDQPPAFVIAGGQSGNPLSPHYADWLADWRDGKYRSIAGGADRLKLNPLRSAP
jgi:penicillin amidase